jgi:cell division transport system permease protein
MTMRRALHLARSVVNSALLGLRQGAAVHSLSVGIIALALTALGAFAVVLLNVSRLSDAWNRELVVVGFLRAGAPVEDVNALVEQVRQQAGVLEVTVVDQAAARARLLAALGDRAAILHGLEDRVIPTAVEVELLPGTVPATAQVLAQLLEGSPVILEVAWGQEEISRLGAVVGIMRIAGGLLGALIALVAILVISNTLKLTVLARREEIEIMRLVGASEWFVRAPFLLEGAVQGLSGAAVAGGCLMALHSAVAWRVEEVLLDAFGPISLGGPPWPVAVALLVAGGMLGVLGGLVGVSRFVRE